ncbi:methionyl aminopeptidase [Sulfidibacter corallicola]|uniref:Methionine aminopeptidase n=1 Tax=Sulfidibacter corallicola TaxID=2818388 RepID=A0A8A4TGA1_SULCO|nr:methionyl aminopeptidase [Sulfidibacter corallicola]QTD48212.1 methionyl aminopeptidase [Sulfidibacter corallicola]
MNKIGRNDPCFCGSGKKYKKCHGRPGAVKPATTTKAQTQMKRPDRSVPIMTKEELPKMRAACRLAANILDTVCAKVVPGITTKQIDDWVLEMTLEAGAYPAPLNYPKGHTDPRNPVITPGGFPKNCCTSINEVVCHGIPNENDVLKDGDIVNIDVTCILDGYFGDTSRTVYVGEPSEEARLVTETARECLRLGIETVRPGGRLIEVGRAIADYAKKFNLGVVKEYTGHGIGTVFHAEPQVCHYPNPTTDCPLVPGMTFTIEPMINGGTWHTELDKGDGWTVYTRDRRLSAQFEHTILVTETGHEILTLPG